MTWKTILVPHDFSSCANHATALARDVAHSHGARLVLLHVGHMPLGFDPDALVTPAGGGAAMSARDVVTGSAGEHIEDLAARLRKDGVAVTTKLAVGDIVDEILAASEQEQADLIVMGTHGRTGIALMVVGSVTEKVVRRSAVPVLTLRDE
jgi:nucleotide-binding universal stress UspA family protein